MADDRNVHKLLQYLYSGKFPRTYWELLRQGGGKIDREALEKEILQSDRSDKSIYVAIMRTYGFTHPDWEHAEAPILGDKTPGHLYHVPELLEWFPEAKIVHTFRDPRAIMASEWKRLLVHPAGGLMSRLRGSVRSVQVVLYVTVTWLYAVRLHHIYKARYPDNYYLSKYEDLVEDPQSSVPRLCRFVGLDAGKEIHNPGKRGSSFGEAQGEGFDRDAIDRWRAHLKPWMKFWLAIWVGRYLKEFGYRS
jgi:hypothetical protein